MKGQGILGSAIPIVMGIVLLGFLLGAGAIGFNALQGSVTTGTYMQNVTSSTIGNSTVGLADFAAQMPNVGTIGGIAVLLIVLLGAFVMFMPRQ